MPHTFGIGFKNKNRTCTFPNKCPQCHHTVTINSSQTVNTTDYQAEVVLICPNDHCRRLFIAYYRLNKNNEMELAELQPSIVEIDIASLVVAGISPTFYFIYRQATQARSLGLTEIAGPGFRKAFEFLIKDYAKAKSTPENHKRIEESFAATVIKEFISDGRIEKVAKRALWIGNDETHYLRKWENHDIEDLITLIKLTVNWIEIERLSNQYSEDLPDPVK